MVRTDVGECGIHWGGEEFTFSPSFFAMSQLGTPKQIVDLVKTYGRSNFVWNMVDAASILMACCTSHSRDDVSALLGCAKESKRGGMIWCLGRLPASELTSLQIIAKSLLVNGVFGKPNERRLEESGEPLEEFDASEYASSAMALIHLSRDDAWALTMIEFQRAVDTLYPPKEDKPTQSEAEELLDYTDDINEMLNKRNREAQTNG